MVAVVIIVVIVVFVIDCCRCCSLFLLLQAVLGPLMSDEQNDYSEIFTPTDPRDGWPEAEQINSAMSGISGIHYIAVIFMFKVTPLVLHILVLASFIFLAFSSHRRHSLALIRRTGYCRHVLYDCLSLHVTKTKIIFFPNFSWRVNWAKLRSFTQFKS